MSEYIGEYVVSLTPKTFTDLRFHRHEEIVRCRDCKWYCEEWNRKLMRDTISCDWFDGAHVKPDGFCAWGERETVNKTGEFVTHDKVDVVRCRDCIHYKPYRTDKHGMMNRCHDEHGHTHKRDESDFCSRGERREQ